MACCTVQADVVESEDSNSTTNETQKVEVFPDVSSTASYAEAVNALHEYGIIGGDDKGNFNPDSNVTRAEAAALMCRLIGAEEAAKKSSTTSFTDVSTKHWANGYVATAAKQGIINGYGNGKFGPSDSVTYAQMIKMLVCAWGYENDAKQAGGWPDGYITFAEDAGYSKGLVIKDFNNSAKRSDVAMLIYNSFCLD